MQLKLYACPTCNSSLTTIQNYLLSKLFNFLTLNVFNNKKLHLLIIDLVKRSKLYLSLLVIFT